MYKKERKDILIADHVTQVCEAHHRVIFPSFNRCKDLRGQTQESIGRNAHVKGDVRRNTRSQGVKAGAIE